MNWNSKVILAGAALVMTLIQSHAAITYVDALHGSSGNTYATGGSLADTSWTVTKNNSNPDNSHWDVRTYGTDGNCYQAYVSSLDSMPEITTEFTITDTNGWYDIYAFFYDHSEVGEGGWNLSIGFTSGSQTTHSATSPGVVSASNLTYVVDPTFDVVGVIHLYAVKVGQVQVTTGSLDVSVFVDKLSGTYHTGRTWYDGVGYAPGVFEPPPFEKYVDANEINTVASGGSPDPFHTTAETTGNLWRKRTGFGFDANGKVEVFEKDTWSGQGDAVPLETTADGLVPGEEYGVYVCFMSLPDESWQVLAGLTPSELIQFNSSTAGRITDLGAASGTSFHQYLGFIGNTNAALDGTITVNIDDGNGPGDTGRTWYEGIYIGATNSVMEVSVPGDARLVAPDGAWCWFQDERAIWHEGYLFAGYVKSDGKYGVTRYNPVTSNAVHMIISTAASEQANGPDDHNNPSITVLPDGRLLLVYSDHGWQTVFYYRTSKVSNPSSIADWNDEQSHYAGAATTYANTYCLSGEDNKIYNFHRAIGYDPTLTMSTDTGETWGVAQQVINAGDNSQRPYPRYCSNHEDRIDLIYTDAHPDAQPTAIYHMYYKTNAFWKTDGTQIKTMAAIQGGSPIDHGSFVTDNGKERGSIVYGYSEAAWGPGDGLDDWIPNGRAWTWDVAYGADGHPVCLFHVQPFGAPASDRFYYYYARWTGTEWQKHCIATGGGSIGGHFTYSGGMSIDPDDPRIVYISSNANDPFDLSDPFNIAVSSTNKHEIYRGVTFDGGDTFEWEPVTSNSASGNVRPIVPENHGRKQHVLWFYGRYTAYTDFDTKIAGIIDGFKGVATWQADYGITNIAATVDSDGDGLSDLTEYALGGNPTNSVDAPKPVYTNGVLSFSYQQILNDIECGVKITSSLTSGGWTEIATVGGGLPHSTQGGYTINTAGGDPETLSIDIGTTNGPTQFINLEVRDLLSE